jgi:hypothetical protein
MKIIDNFIAKEEINEIETCLTGVYFPWYYQNSVATEKNVDNFYFTHLLYDGGEQSKYFNLIIPLLKKIKYKKIIRIKANLYPNINKKINHPKHVDYNFQHKGALYYINTNNGETIINNKKIDSVRNRIVFFDSSKEHNSTTCTDQKIRLNININYQ